MRVWAIVSVACVVSVLFCPWQAQAVVVWNDWTAGNEVLSLRQEGGRLYVGTYGGLVIWDLQTRSYSKLDVRDGLPDNWVSCTAVASQDIVWVGCRGGGLCLVDGATVTRFSDLPGTDAITEVEVDRAGVVWVGSEFGGLSWFDGARFSWTDFGCWPPPTVEAIAIGGNGSVWVAASERGLMVYSGGAWMDRTPNGCRLVRDVEISAGDAVWVLGGKTVLWHLHRGCWARYSMPEPVWNADDIAVGPDGTVWLACDEGLAAFDGTTWFRWTEWDGTSLVELTRVWTCQDSGILWLGLRNGGVVEIRGGSVFRWVAGDPITTSRSVSLASEGRTVWVGMDHARLAAYDGGSWRIVELLPNAPFWYRVFDLAVDHAGTKWVCCRGAGLLRYDGESVFAYTPANSPLTNYEPETVMVDDEGVVWVFDGRQLLAFNGKVWAVFDESSGFPLTSVASMCQAPDGALWFGGYPGVCRYDGSRWEHFRAATSGLPSDEVYGVAQALDGRTWFATWDGLACKQGDAWITFTTSNSGLAFDELFDVAVDEDGTVWFASFSHGIGSFDGKEWRWFKPEDSPLVYDGARAVLAAPSGVWVSTVGGLSRRTSMPPANLLQVQLDGHYRLDSLCLRTSLENPIGDVWGDVYLWVECPDGSSYFLPSLSQEPERLARKVRFPDGLKLDDLPIFTCDASSVPPGRYTFRLIIMNRNSKTEPLSNIASCEWEFEK